VAAYADVTALSRADARVTSSGADAIKARAAYCCAAALYAFLTPEVAEHASDS
jgi:hypothetical protein